jgi:hypothetical protein
MKKSGAKKLKGLVRFAERRNLISALVPSHFSWPLPYLHQIGPLSYSNPDKSSPQFQYY